MSSSTPSHTPTSPAFYLQAVLSFGLSLTAVGIGVVFLPVDGWVRAFLGIAMLYCVTSAFTLAKVIRDRQEDTYISSRVDRARLDKLLTEHDPFKLDAP
ncbi:YiaA/YiaB family inner membrane protein [Lentzea sp. NPDC051838]|uniref:YiaA/YiaB family inner membrane protein n=1 Tax=Lentzea sp. NPDC051838 TaxID=3154849 RepID=UPI0034176285